MNGQAETIKAKRGADPPISSAHPLTVWLSTGRDQGPPDFICRLVGQFLCFSFLPKQVFSFVTCGFLGPIGSIILR